MACAEGLSSTRPIDAPKYLALLDEMAAAVRVRVEKSARLFRLKPAEFKNSEAVFRVMTMEHVLRVGFGVGYDPAVAEYTRTGKPWFSTDATETFVHGILSDKRLGTCSTLPVFAVAVGRRCGYPLYFVRVPLHGLYRWHDEREKFNYQHHEGGGDIQPDEYYHKWPIEWTESEFAMNARAGVWLRSMTARQEVSKFLCNRVFQLRDEGRYAESLDAVRAAKRFDPVNPACGCLEYELLVKMSVDRLGATFNLDCFVRMEPIVISSPVEAMCCARSRAAATVDATDTSAH